MTFKLCSRNRLYICCVLGLCFGVAKVYLNLKYKQKPENASSRVKSIIRSEDTVIFDKNTFGQKYLNCSSKDSVASSQFSRLEFMSRKDNVYVVRVIVFDGRNVQKNVGGDVIVLWAEKKHGNQSVAGHVVDNHDGTYTGKLRIYWIGETVIRAKLVSAFEHQCVRSNALYQYGDSNFAREEGFAIFAVFIKRKSMTRTLCSTDDFNNKKQLCNFTHMNDAMPWYCVHPKGDSFKCADFKFFRSSVFSTNAFPSQMKISNLDYGTIQYSLKASIYQITKVTYTTKCWQKPCRHSWFNEYATGYLSRGRWISIVCDNHDMPLSVNFYQKCLRGKHITLLGDSTVNQYMNYFLEYVLDLPEQSSLQDDFYNNKVTFHSNKTFHNYGITVVYKRHEYPFYGTKAPSINVTSVASAIYELARSDINSENLVLLVHYNLHFHAYPVKSFGYRIKAVVNALSHLLAVKPASTIIFKGPHLITDANRWFDNRLALIYKDIIYDEFSALFDKVFYLNTWDISIATNEEKMHPNGNSSRSQIQMLMSYICKY